MCYLYNAQCYGTITECHRSDIPWDITECYKAIIECCRALRNTTEHCGALGTLQNVAETLWGVAERYRTQQSIVGRYKKRCELLRNAKGALQSRYITLRNCYGKYQFCPYTTEC